MFSTTNTSQVPEAEEVLSPNMDITSSPAGYLLTSSVQRAFSTIELSGSYRHIMALVVEREAGNQPLLGQLLVAEDIIGRVHSDTYNSDIEDVL